VAATLRNVSVGEIERRLDALDAHGESDQRTSVLTHMAWVPPKWSRAVSSVMEGLGTRVPSRTLLLHPDPGARSNRIKAKVTQRIRTDCVYLVHGFGAASKGLSRAFAKGADDQGMITRYAVDPICGSTGMHVNFVRLEKEKTHA
jgi:hypothetical protein